MASCPTYNDYLVRTMKGIYGAKWLPNAKVWTFPLHPEAILMAVQGMDGKVNLTLSDKVEEYLKAVTMVTRPAEKQAPIPLDTFEEIVPHTESDPFWYTDFEDYEWETYKGAREICTSCHNHYGLILCIELKAVICRDCFVTYVLSYSERHKASKLPAKVARQIHQSSAQERELGNHLVASALAMLNQKSGSKTN